ncbi:hypothetical protein [Candidatus Thalassolituus haligoni]|uniref:hypothetical protein n=1 Tax=Candidatus Thalassolituus haligoni TaxID=3100113 RepID=UPI003518A1E4|tara:strand:+ start:6508 stop:7623 length:1116 start_codon:yes stop_codon:yes gene_type:complete
MAVLITTVIRRVLRWAMAISSVSLACQATAANVPLVHNCLAFDGQNCSVSVSVRKKSVSMWLDQPDASVPEAVTSVLKEYYAAARNNDTAKIADTFSVADKSRSKILEEMRKNPGKYARFYQVKAVKLNMLASIGLYYLVGVEWYGEGSKRLAGWSELVHCADDCKMSAQMMSASDPLINFANVVVYPGESIQQPVGGHVIEYPQSSDRSGIFGYQASGNNAQLKAKFAAVKELRQAFLDNQDIIANAGDDIVAKIVATMSPYWNNPNSTDVTYLPRPNSTGMHALNVISLNAVLANVQEISPLLLIQGNYVDFVFFKMKFSDTDQRLAFLAVGDNGKIVPQIQLERTDGVIAQAFQTSVVYRDIQQRLMP